jgi:replication factor C subunit 3/5
MLWVDQHRPKTLEELSYHDSTTQRLEALVGEDNATSMPHLFVYGPSGAGKKTRINTLLQKIYGNGALKLKLDKRTFTTPSKKPVEVNMVSSAYHIELCPGDAGFNDRFVVQEIIKEMASNRSLNTKKGGVDFKIVVLHEVDRLSKQAQAALRRTMEKYASTCRLILVCNSPSKVMEPVRSRCLGIRIPAPTIDDVSTITVSWCIYIYVAGWLIHSLPHPCTYLSVSLPRFAAS